MRLLTSPTYTNMHTDISVHTQPAEKLVSHYIHGLFAVQNDSFVPLLLSFEKHICLCVNLGKWQNKKGLIYFNYTT